MPKRITAKSTNLTPRQQLFCKYYLLCPTATEAAIKAGYKNTEFLGTNTDKLLKVTKIQDEITRLRAEARKDPKIATPEQLLEGYTRDLLLDPNVLYNKNGEPKSIHDIPQEVRLSLVGVGLDKHGRFRYQLPNKNQVRDSMCRVLGLTNGNGDVIKALLEALGVINIQINNNYNVDWTHLDRVIDVDRR